MENGDSIGCAKILFKGLIIVSMFGFGLNIACQP